MGEPIRATRRAHEPDAVQFELGAVRVKDIFHLIRAVWPERHRKRYPVGQRPGYKRLADYILITLGTSEGTVESIAIRFQDVRLEAVEQPDESLAMEASRCKPYDGGARLGRRDDGVREVPRPVPPGLIRGGAVEALGSRAEVRGHRRMISRRQEWCAAHDEQHPEMTEHPPGGGWNRQLSRDHAQAPR